MPAYEYNCLDCKQRFEVFMSYTEYGHKDVHCTHCGSANIKRRLSRVRFAKSEDSRMEDLAGDFDDPAALAGLEEDPQALGRGVISHALDQQAGPLGDVQGHRQGACHGVKFNPGPEGGLVQ